MSSFWPYWSVLIEMGAWAQQSHMAPTATGSARVYNAVTKQCIAKLEGHEDEISKVSCVWFVPS